MGREQREFRMAVLVTGSAGHLGEALMRTFRMTGAPAIGCDLKASPYTDVVADIADRAILRKVLAEVSAVIHTATLHKPHIVTHSHDAFVRTNIAGTLALLEESVAAGIDRFVFTSTTSAFGAALTPLTGAPAAWVTEEVQPVPKNIYGVTKTAAESLCEMFARRRGLPAVVLRTSRFFPEADDDPRTRQAFTPDNLQANELLYRRVDLDDAVKAHLAALARAPQIGFGRYIISAATPFEPEDLAELRVDAPAVISRRFPDCAALYRQAGWRMLPAIDRVYVSRKAMRELGWVPAYGFPQVLDALATGGSFRSPLARAVGQKGYHATIFEDGPYPVG
jgi:UDP-glucose 4-epimerase